MEGGGENVMRPEVERERKRKPERTCVRVSVYRARVVIADCVE